jgi:hypothetical protein
MGLMVFSLRKKRRIERYACDKMGDCSCQFFSEKVACALKKPDLIGMGTFSMRYLALFLQTFRSVQSESRAGFCREGSAVKVSSLCKAFGPKFDTAESPDGAMMPG